MGGADVHNHRSLVGLDVHARSTIPAVLDLENGELRFRRLNGPPRSVVNFLETLPGPVLAVYQAWPDWVWAGARGRGAGDRGAVLRARFDSAQAR
jgi:hypothetical protein